MELEIRDFTGTVAEDGRTISGIAVPYNDKINAGGYSERFAAGAIDSIEDVKLFYGHAEPIGKVVRGEDTPEGFLIEARISDTPKGNEVRTLLQDGVLNKFSVGFNPLEDTRDDDGTVVRTKVRLREVSVVPFPAYENASVLSVREEEAPKIDLERKENTMETNTNSEIAELRSLVEDMDRRMIVSAETVPAHAVPQYRSFGEFVHAVVSGDENALALTRTYGGAAVADSIMIDPWVSSVIRLVDLGRPTVNAFRRQALPAEGMNVEWPQVKTNTLEVDTQAAEGDLLHYGAIALEPKTSAVKTFGGYTTMSRQVIERSSVNYLDVAFRAMAIAYSKYVNASAIAALKAVTGTGSASVAATAKGWFEAIADSAVSIYTNTGLRPEFILAAPDVYKSAVVHFDSLDRPIIGGVAPENQIGSSNLVNLTANVGGLTMIVDPALSAGDCFIANSEAFVTYESGGAPFRLNHDDVTALTRDFSVYGYAAFAAPLPEAIVHVTVA